MLRKATATVAGLAMAAALISVVPATAQEPYREPTSQVTSTKAERSIVPAVYYEPSAQRFGIHSTRAEHLGYSSLEVERLQSNLDELTAEESVGLAEILGLNEYIATQQERAIPVFVWAMAAVLGQVAVDTIVSQITNWGISGACRNLEGRWNEFYDFCRSNGHI